MAGNPMALLLGKTATHFMPIRSSRPAPSAPRRNAGIAWTSESSGRGWTPIFGGSSASATSAIIVRSARSRRSSRSGIAASTSGADGRAGRVHRREASLRVYPGAMAYDGSVAPIDVAQSLDNLKLERDAIVLYDALASIEKDPRRAAAFQRIAGNERRHADVWASKLRALGADVPPPAGPRMRVRFIIFAARIAGTSAVAELVKSMEGDEEALYEGQGTGADVAAIAADEREHADIWDQLKADERIPGMSSARPRRRGHRPRRDQCGRHRPSRDVASRRRSIRDPPGGDLRDQRWPGQQPVAGHGCGRGRVGQPELRPPRRDRRAAGRRVQHGGGRIHLDAEPARAVRAPDRPRESRDGGDARGRGG